MSKFYQYINEKPVSDDVTEAGKVVSKDCTEIIDFYRKSPVVSTDNAIFRGTKKKISVISNKIKPRKNRKPTDTPQELQNRLDFYFDQNFGGEPRSNGVFTFGNNQVTGYGKGYAVFPANGFGFLWSKEVRDLYLTLRYHDIIIKGDIAPFYRANTADLDANIKSIVNTYTNKNLEKALLSGNEIVINCDYYYLVPQNIGEGILDYYIKE